MRIQEHSNKLETNVNNDTQEFGIGDASVVIEILRNRLYEHKVRTLVQEYICNARDAMREVGKANAFEVTVPTRLNPVFKVRDFGPGISPDRMRDVFVMYGSSTKRGSNSQTGGFGIGAKSAWSYTDSFTIIAIVDGVRRTYVAHTGVNNNGRLDLVSTDATSESSGTEIQVAVKPYDIEEFRLAVFRAIYFWDEKPTLKGELNPPTLVSGLKVSSLIEVIDGAMLPEYVRPRSYNNEALAVIDGVPYVITDKLVSKIEALKKLGNIVKKEMVFHFGNGIVEVSASRESIADSKHTLASIEKMAVQALSEVKNHIKDAFDKVKDTSQYLQTYSELSKLFDVDQHAKFGSYHIENSSIHSPYLKKVKLTVVHCMGKYGRARVEKISKEELKEGRKYINIDRFNHLFFISKDESNVQQNKRIREYFKTNTHMILVEPMNVIEYGTPIVDAQGNQVPVIKSQKLDVASYKKVLADLSAKDFNGITYIEPPKAQRVKVSRQDTEFCMHVLYGNRHAYTTLSKNSKKWLYIPIKDGSMGDTSSLKELNDYLTTHEGMSICGLAPRALSMIKGSKSFTLLSDWLDNYKPTKEAVAWAQKSAAKNKDVVEVLARLKGIDDEFLVEMIEEYREIEKTKHSFVPEVLINKMKDNKELKDFTKKDETLTKLMKSEYPIVQELGKYCTFKDDMVFYINAKFNSKKGRK